MSKMLGFLESSSTLLVMDKTKVFAKIGFSRSRPSKIPSTPFYGKLELFEYNGQKVDESYLRDIFISTSGVSYGGTCGGCGRVRFILVKISEKLFKLKLPINPHKACLAIRCPPHPPLKNVLGNIFMYNAMTSFDFDKKSSVLKVENTATKISAKFMLHPEYTRNISHDRKLYVGNWQPSTIKGSVLNKLFVKNVNIQDGLISIKSKCGHISLETDKWKKVSSGYFTKIKKVESELSTTECPDRTLDSYFNRIVRTFDDDYIQISYDSHKDFAEAPLKIISYRSHWQENMRLEFKR